MFQTDVNSKEQHICGGNLLRFYLPTSSMHICNTVLPPKGPLTEYIITYFSACL